MVSHRPDGHWESLVHSCIGRESYKISWDYLQTSCRAEAAMRAVAATTAGMQGGKGCALALAALQRTTQMLSLVVLPSLQ